MLLPVSGDFTPLRDFFNPDFGHCNFRRAHYQLQKQSSASD